jgi:hypothetical protein
MWEVTAQGALNVSVSPRLRNPFIREWIWGRRCRVECLLYVCSTGGTIFGWLVFHCPDVACMLPVCSELRIRSDHLHSFPSYFLFHFVDCLIPHTSPWVWNCSAEIIVIFKRTSEIYGSDSNIAEDFLSVLCVEFLLLVFGSFVNGMASFMISFSCLSFQSSDGKSTWTRPWSGTGWTSPGAGRLGAEFQTHLPWGQWRPGRHFSFLRKVRDFFIYSGGLPASYAMEISVNFNSV